VRVDDNHVDDAALVTTDQLQIAAESRFAQNLRRSSPPGGVPTLDLEITIVGHT
jgi:hypothetical protein